MKLPRVAAFETGRNEWRLPNTGRLTGPGHESLPGCRSELSWNRRGTRTHRRSILCQRSRRPVPYSAEIRTIEGHLFMVEDQRFAWTRPDVLYYQTNAGKRCHNCRAHPRQSPRIHHRHRFRLCCETDRRIPGECARPEAEPLNVRMGGFQMLLAGDILRAKFRSSFANPEPMSQTRSPAWSSFGDKYHTFLKGHRIMVQVQSSWFPMFDRNPQKFWTSITPGVRLSEGDPEGLPFGTITVLCDVNVIGY